jgi:hypothetical protein
MGLFDNETVVAGEVDSWDRAAARLLREKYVTLLTITDIWKNFIRFLIHVLSWYWLHVFTHSSVHFHVFDSFSCFQQGERKFVGMGILHQHSSPEFDCSDSP